MRRIVHCSWKMPPRGGRGTALWFEYPFDCVNDGKDFFQFVFILDQKTAETMYGRDDDMYEDRKKMKEGKGTTENHLHLYFAI